VVEPLLDDLPADADTDRALGMSLVEDTGLDAVDAGTLAE
jgi:hypothetical protein